MAIYRNVALTFWTDIKVVDDFTPEDKYFMMYCLTNPHTNIIGCYEISLKQMSTEMGYTIESIQAILKRFNEKHQTVLYDEETKELYIKNWHKYNWTSSTKILQPIITCYNQIKSQKFKCLVGEKVNETYGIDTVSIPYRYGIDTTVSVSDTESETDLKKEEKNQIDYGKQKKSIDYQEYIDTFNMYCTKLPKVKVLTDKRKKQIKALATKIDLEEFREICSLTNENEFLTGNNNRGWQADFDFITRLDKAVIILEGGYKTSKPKTEGQELLDLINGGVFDE